jgi:hypothetical protein
MPIGVHAGHSGGLHHNVGSRIGGGGGRSGLGSHMHGTRTNRHGLIRHGANGWVAGSAPDPELGRPVGGIGAAVFKPPDTMAGGNMASMFQQLFAQGMPEQQKALPKVRRMLSNILLFSCNQLHERSPCNGI